MSADNGYVLDYLPEENKYVVMMYFASDNRNPQLHESHPRFDTFNEAAQFADAEWSEYGWYPTTSAVDAAGQFNKEATS